MKILLIVEGEKTEPVFFQHLMDVFGVDAEIVMIGTSLYSLYERMKYYHFESDVRDVLKEIQKPSLDGSLLDQRFTYTYLVYDSDLQHTPMNQRNDKPPLDALTSDNLSKLREMARYFTNETDPAIGRLYINYPMMESFRYCDSFTDEEFISARIPIAQMPRFKALASQKKLAGRPIESYTKENFADLIRLHIRKLHAMYTVLPLLPSYSEYVDESESEHILHKQVSLVDAEQTLNVLNSSLFILIDYFGNRNGFYEQLITKAEA